ncbi:MAG: hypothetical protein JRJ64_16585, partial [Deltaproteobacteria bacterium]|nr:hypothetical protein [Deltaproteobacteria bacterium]
HLGGRKGDYDDIHYEFNGGAKDQLRKKHYDKSMRLLWKAEDQAPWLGFRDCTAEELTLLSMAEKSMNREELRELKRVRSEEFRDTIMTEYTERERQAIVNVLSLIGHGEAYAWLVSTELLNEVKSTGARSALTMQVLEEAKHFVVLRELLEAFECEIPRMSIYEYLLLERGFKSKGVEKFFAMNVVVEGFALGLFGMMSTLPGLEILRLFHRDESRHTALPTNYLKEFPLTKWQRRNLFARVHRLSLILPLVPAVALGEEDLAELGIDAFDFAGATARKVFHLSDRVGFSFPIPTSVLTSVLNVAFNAVASYTRADHTKKDYLQAETTRGKEELQTEAEVFGLNRGRTPTEAARRASEASYKSDARPAA